MSSMERSLRLLLVLIAKLVIIHLVHAQNPQGFSLDCGLSEYEPSPYTESLTGLQFSSDTAFIQSGKTGIIQNSAFIKPYNTLRYFPDGIRNCYNLNVEKGRNHLIRARFVYGNYDGRDTIPNFDLYLGPNLWATIVSERFFEEILHTPTSNKLQICLVKTGVTTPMISALEIRLMGNDSYITNSGSLRLFFRRYLSNSGARNYVRYPDDAYDRQWDQYFQKEWTQISTTRDVNNSNHYKPPKKALATAAIPTYANEPLTIEWTNSHNASTEYYLYSHFAEIQDLQDNETREFNMVFNGELILSDPVNLYKLHINTVISTSPSTCEGGKCNYQLKRTNKSTLPPLLNAIEVYTVIQFPQSETDESDVDAIKDITTSYALSRVNWQGDPCIPQQLRWDGLNCSNTYMSTPPRITSLNLSSSALSGNIAAAIQHLTQLERLDLSNNNLTGGVPEFLGKMKLLSFINLSGNDLNGSIPQVLQKKGIELFVDGNPRLCVTDSCPKPPKKKFPVAKAIIASVTFAAVIIAVLVFFLILRKKQPKILEGILHLPRWTSTADGTFANKKSKRFRYSEVVKMTSKFQRVIGKGGFGMVYQGTLNGSKQVAVKVLSQSSAQGYKEFKAEVDLLLRVHHTNLVSLIGYCYEGDRLALIYEFLPNGDLKQHLSGRGGRPIIDWTTRLRIALEAALGLEYLHIGCTPPMVHRDVKTANILLDENFKAKIADFGLTRTFQGEGESQVSTDFAGTPGYFDPEYLITHRLSEKSDVYSFGIVLLEMITNQPVINQTSANSCITQWVGSKVNLGDITEIMDPKLGRDYDTNSAWRALDLAMSCSNPSSSQRPSMSQVVQDLKNCIACVRSGLSNSRGLEVNVVVDTSVVPRAR